MKIHTAGRLVLFGMVTIGLLELVACGEEKPTPTNIPVTQSTSTAIATEEGDVRILSVSATEYSFGAMQFTIPAGRTTLRLTNKGQETHELRVMRFKEGVLIHQFMGTLHQGGGVDAALQLVTDRGQVAAIGSGQTTESIVDLPAGEYVLICLVPSPDGTAHALKGMAAALTVTDAP